MIDAYAPCPCGSGNKYKFCCRGKDRELQRESRGTDEINDEAQELMFEGDYAQAAALLERAIVIAPRFTPTRNNLAQTRFLQGDLESAAKIASEVLERIDPHNVFAAALLAEIHHLQDDPRTSETFDRLKGMIAADPYAVGKKAEAFSMPRMHRDVLEAVESARCPVLSDAFYFAGVAAANLGERDKAGRYLRRIGRDEAFYDRAQKTLQSLDKGPDEFVYLEPFDYLPRRIIESLAKRELKGGREILVDLALIAMESDPRTAVQILGDANTSRARTILRRIALGTEETDELRSIALSLLLEIGGIAPGEEVSVFAEGKWQKIRPKAIEISVEPSLELTGEAADLLRRADQAMRRRQSKKAVEALEKLLKIKPDYPPALHNLAIVHLRKGRIEEAERLVQRALELDPSYTFAAATLASIRLQQNRVEEADKLLTDFKLPRPIHPSAFAYYERVLTEVAIRKGDRDRAAKHFYAAQEIEPREELTAMELGLRGLLILKESQAKQLERERRKPIAADVSMAQALSRYSVERIYGIVKAAKLRVPWGLKRAEALARAAEALSDSERIRTAAGEDLAALGQVVRAGGVVDLGEFLKEHPEALERLKACGLVFEGSIGGLMRVVAPLEVRRAF